MYSHSTADSAVNPKGEEGKKEGVGEVLKKKRHLAIVKCDPSSIFPCPPKTACNHTKLVTATSSLTDKENCMRSIYAVRTGLMSRVAVG